MNQVPLEAAGQEPFEEGKKQGGLSKSIGANKGSAINSVLQKQQYLNSIPNKAAQNFSQSMYGLGSNNKKQTTTKKSRYDDSYLSENTTPTKMLPQ